MTQRMSLPTRERELKHLTLGSIIHDGRSLPTRERELKLDGVVTPTRNACRSPRGSVN